MNAPRADANKSMAEVENTAVSLSGILKSIVTYIKNKEIDNMDNGFVQCWFWFWASIASAIWYLPCGQATLKCCLNVRPISDIQVEYDELFVMELVFWPSGTC